MNKNRCPASTAREGVERGLLPTSTDAEIEERDERSNAHQPTHPQKLRLALTVKPRTKDIHIERSVNSK
jgi:hypothetical protein